MTQSAYLAHLAHVLEALHAAGSIDDPDDRVYALAFWARTNGFDLIQMAQSARGEPVPLILHCPDCCRRHIDAPDVPGYVPHRTHACQHCGFNWAPAVVETVGVQFLPGCKDE